VRLNHFSMARVVIENLVKIFKGPKGEDVRAVNNASLIVEDKEFMVLVGPSGCGKSTTLRLIAGLEDITSGTISLDGKMVHNIAPKDRDIAMVFQNYALYPHMTAYENMAFGLKLRNYSPTEIDARVKDAAEILCLRDCLDRKPKSLSGGQCQRVAVGRAIVRKPKVFLFDEPLSNLDAQMRVQMRKELSKLHKHIASTMIYVTHDQVEAMTMGDRITVMKEGVIQQVAGPMNLYDHPANQFVAGFIGSPSMNFFPGMLLRQAAGVFFQPDMVPGQDCDRFMLRVEDQKASNLANNDVVKVILGIRPEHIRLGDEPSECAVDAVAEAIEPLGSETFLHLVHGGHSFVARIPHDCRVGVAQKIRLIFDISKGHFFDPVTGKSMSVQ
jgi:multiple sugar transport system ATP-binding protein